MSTVDLLLHPIRLRVVQAFLGDRVLTTGELRGELADVPVASLYRHVGTLVQAGVLVVAGEQKVRGAVERSYRLVAEAASVSAEDLAAMTPEDHRRAFTTFVAALLADFDRYLDQETVDLARDGVGYRQIGLWLDDAEFTELVTDLRAVLLDRAGNRPGSGRRRRLVNVVHLPGQEPPAGLS
ncbi:helix-turn-helix domain-containing protein [Blastococcus sp. TF02A_35]|uniref:helix-turn-helix domain-containing protein n=1 Tax=Blastococcus sp. TF02A-35 TaxID=2559612 RepID=UPI001072EFE6|nr:helix-turn-helix domain-containing protein [Blastococcus sp. TF02A_35]TFV44621.1 ArsR family transcriptional regulator [Blastococcus sp. TF02A_35]